MVVKPRSSSGGRGLAYLHPGDDTAEAWSAVHGQHPFPMLQEWIPSGPKFDVGVLMDLRGCAVASFVQKELRHFPIRDGLSTMQESIWRPDLVERAVRRRVSLGELNERGAPEGQAARATLAKKRSGVGATMAFTRSS